MKTKERILRYSMLIIGVAIMSLGIALSIKSDLGTTSISAIPYVLSLGLPIITVGEYTIIFNLLLVVLQFVILKKFEVKLFSQMIICFIFGYFIDFMVWAIGFLAPASYLERWIVCLLGCFVLAFGILIEMKSDITMLPGDAAIGVIADAIKMEYGRFKPIFDSTLVIIAALLSLYFFGYLLGVREGTIAAAIFVGMILKFYQDHLGYRIDDFLENLDS